MYPTPHTCKHHAERNPLKDNLKSTAKHLRPRALSTPVVQRLILHAAVAAVGVNLMKPNGDMQVPAGDLSNNSAKTPFWGIEISLILRVEPVPGRSPGRCAFDRRQTDRRQTQGRSAAGWN